VAQLDNEIASLRSHTFSKSTKKTYTFHLQTYMKFCMTHGLPPVPASPLTIYRYLAFMSRSKVYSTIQQYVSVIKLLHLELGLEYEMKSNHQITSLMKAIRRVKGQNTRYKLTLSMDNLISMKHHLNLATLPDMQMWCVILTCYYGLLRISNITVPHGKAWDNDKIIRRQDLQVCASGCVLTIRWSKTLQYRERAFEAVLPYLATPICPTTALLNFLKLAGTLPPNAPLLAFKRLDGQVVAPTPSSARTRLRKLLTAVGLPTEDYNTHSLRRSGASYLLMAGMPLELIRVLGDWKSDCVFQYLKPQASSKLALVQKSFS
jgi:integrase